MKTTSSVTPISETPKQPQHLKYRNANGAHIYIGPTGESAYTLLDDLNPTTLHQLEPEDYRPAAVVETSPGSFQAWLRHEQSFSKELGTLTAKTLAKQFAADRSAADWRRFGRAPGFTNRKPRHCNGQGLYPFARLHSHAGEAFAEAGAFRARTLVFSVNYSFALTTVISPYERHLPPSTADDILVGLG